MIRPQVQAKKKVEETIKSAKTGDKVVTSSGIHGVITNVKDSTVIVRVADNVKLEIEKSHIEKITRPEADAEKVVAAKVS
jgi:preprotein translocase subunit YajC